MVKSENNDPPTDEVSFTHQPPAPADDEDDNDEGAEDQNNDNDDLLGAGAGDQHDIDDEQRTGRENSSKPQVKAEAPADDCSEITTENAADGGGAVQKIKEINDEITMTFPQKLHEILSAGAYDDIVAWLSHGQSFMIHKKRVFETEILGKFFKKSKFTSFTRKLNRWGFSRITRGAENGAYFHALFRRDQPRLCLQMSNRSGGNASGGGGGNGASTNPTKFARSLIEAGPGAQTAAASTPLMPFPMAPAAGNNFLFPGMYSFDPALAAAAAAGNNPFNNNMQPGQSPQQQQQQQQQQQTLLQQLQFQQLQLQQLQFQQQQQQMQAAFMQQHQMQGATPGQQAKPGEGNIGSSDAQQLKSQNGMTSPQQPQQQQQQQLQQQLQPNAGMAMMNNLHDWSMFQKFAGAQMQGGAPAGNNSLGISNLFPPAAMMNSFAPGMLTGDLSSMMGGGAPNFNLAGVVANNNNNGNNGANNNGNNNNGNNNNGNNILVADTSTSDVQAHV